MAIMKMWWFQPLPKQLVGRIPPDGVEEVDEAEKVGIVVPVNLIDIMNIMKVQRNKGNHISKRKNGWFM